jgi:carboxymethylenebutenolidase
VKPDDPAVEGADMTFPGDQGATLLGYLARPKSGGPSPAVMICHENRGLTDHFRDVARRFAKAGYVAIAPDLLSREGGTAKVDPAQVPGKLSANPAQGVADFQAAFRYLQTLPSVQKGQIGMVGFCFGGGITWLCTEAISELKAAVPFYGPNPPLQDVPKIQAAVLGIYGGEDQRIDAGIPAIEQAMQQAGKTFEKVVYPGAGHAFFNDTGASYNEQAALDAWKRTLDWLKKYVG